MDCKFAPATGYVQVTYPNGITVTPAIYVPKSSDSTFCNLGNKARGSQSVTITFGVGFFGAPLVWELNGQVELTTYRSAVGLGMVNFAAKDASYGNVTNSVSLPATSFTRPVSEAFKNVLRPSQSEISKHIKFEWDYISTGQVLALEKIPSFVWRLLGVTGTITQSGLTTWLQTVLALADKPTFTNGLTAFNVAFRASRVQPFQATLSLHNVLSNLGKSFVISSISGTVYGKPGSWSVASPTQRLLGLRPIQDSVFIQVPGKNLIDLCKVKLPLKTRGVIKFVPRLDSANSDGDATLMKLVCQKSVVTSWEASWSVGSSYIDLTPPELSNIANDTNAVKSGQVAFDSVSGLYIVAGIVNGLAVTIAPERNATRTSLNLKKQSAYQGIEWAFTIVLDASKPEPVRSMKLWVHTTGRVQFVGSDTWVSLASPKGKVCRQLEHIVPCLPPTTRGAPAPVVWPLHSTSNYIVKSRPKQGFEAFSKALIANLTVTYAPASLLFNGKTQWTPNVYPTHLNLTVPLAKNRVGVAKLGFNVTLTEGRTHIGSASGVLTKWPCNNVVQGTFNLTQLLPSSMYLNQAKKLSLVSIVDSKLLTGPTNITFTCTPQGDIEFVDLIGQIPDWSTKLFDDAQTIKLVKASFHLVEGYSKVVASHSRTNRTIAFYIHTKSTPIRYLAEPQPIWQFEGLKNASEVNRTLVDFLGATSAKNFRQYLDNSTSRLIRHTWQRPGAENITIGFSRAGNRTLHDLLFFANTRHDPLIGKQVWKKQQLSKMHNVAEWSLKRSGRRWVDPVAYPAAYPQPSGLPVSYDLGRGINLTGQTIPFPIPQPQTTLAQAATPVLQKRQATTTANVTRTSVATSTFAIPTFTNVASSNILANSSVLEVASSEFAYEWVLGSYNMTVTFSGTEVCPPQLQQILMSGNVPAFGNMEGFGGIGSFICSSGQESEPISFAVQASNSNTTILPFNTPISLVNATMQVNCVPDSDTCFWPSVLVGSSLYGFTSAMNGTSYWDSLNTTQLLVNAQQNSGLTSDQQQALVSSLLAGNSSWSQALQQVNIDVPAYLLQDPFALALLAEGYYNVPVASFQCNNEVVYTCDTPTVIASGQLQTVEPQSGSVLMYGAIFSTTFSSALADRQTIAAQFTGFGSFAVNFTQDVCAGPVSGVSYLFTNLTNQIESGTNGVVTFECDGLGNIDTWFFSLPVGNANVPAILGGNSASYNLENASIAYYPITNMLGTQAKYGGLTHMVAVQPGLVNNGSILTATSSSKSQLSSVASTSSPFQPFWQQLSVGVPTTYASFNLSSFVDEFTITYNGSLSGATLGMAVGFYDTISNVFVNTLTKVTLGQTTWSSPWELLNDDSTINITFGAWNSTNTVSLNVDVLPCTSNANGATNLTGFVSLTLPGLYGTLNGNVGVEFVCAPANSNHTWSDVAFSGMIQGPLTFDILGGALVVEEVFVSYDTASGFLQTELSMENAQIIVSYVFDGQNSYINNVAISVPGPISPFNSSLPFSDLWVDALGQAEVNQLTQTVLLDQILIDYTYGPPTNVSGDSFVLQGGFAYGEVAANLYLQMQQVVPQNSTDWFVQASNLQLVINNQIIVSINGSSPCSIGVETATVVVQNIGPFVQPATFMGNVILSCNANNSISEFYFNASGSAIPMTVLGSTEYLSASIAFDSATKVLLVNGGPTSDTWSLNFMIDFGQANSTGWGIAVGTNNPLSWSEVPFTNGINVAFGQTGNAALNNVTGVTLQSFSFLYESQPEAFNLSASIAESGNGYSAGEGLVIDLSKVNGSWTLLDSDFVFDGVFGVGDIGVVVVNGTVACPAGSVDGIASFGGVPAMQMTIDAAASVDYVCHEYFNLSIVMSNLTIGVGNDMLDLSQVGVTYSSLTNLLIIQGSMSVQGAELTGWASVEIVIQIAGNQTVPGTNVTSQVNTGLVSIMVDLGTGSSTSLYNSGLPLSGLVNIAIVRTNTQPVTPSAAMLNLQYTYNAPTLSSMESIYFNAYIQDGSYAGSFVMNLNQVQNLVPGVSSNSTNGTSWEIAVQVDVALTNLGTVSVFGTNPCPDGSLNATANLTIPNVGNQVIFGGANFVCNGTQSIMYWSLEAQDTWTVTIDNAVEVFDGIVEYSSQFDSFGFSAGWQNVTQVFFSYNGTVGNSSSSWDLGVQILSPVGFGSLPYATLMNGALTSSGASLTNPPAIGFEVSSGLIEFAVDGGVDVLTFQLSIAGQSSSVTGSGSADAELVYNGTWSIGSLSLGGSIAIDNVAILSINFDPFCPQASGFGSLLFTNLPLSIPTFGLNVSVQFGCGTKGVNTSDYAIAGTLDEPTSLDFLGEAITINGMSLSYNSSQDVFVFNWDPAPGFTFTLQFGDGLKNGMQQKTGPPFMLTAIYAPTTSPPGAFAAIGGILPSFGSSLDQNSFVNPAASAGETSISNDINGIQLNYLYIEFDAVGDAITMAVDVQFYKVSCLFIAIAQKTSGGTWEAFLGVQTQFDSQLTSPYGWLNSLVGSSSPQAYAQINFFLATGAGTFNLDSQSFSFKGPGLLVSALIDISSGPVNQIAGGSGNTSPATAQGGAFGVALAGQAQNYNSPPSSFGLTPQPGAYLDATLEITSKWAYLSVDMSADVISSSNQQTVPTQYTQLYFLMMCELTGIELTFEFNTVYITELGGTQLEFAGGMGITLGDLGASIVAMFYFNGGWNDPLGLSPYLTISYIAMQISIDLEDGIPDGVDLATQTVMVDPVTVSTAIISADLYLDLESLIQNSAIQFSVTDFSLATIINLFWQSVPSWFEGMLESFSIGSMFVSFNPSLSPTGFPSPLVNVPNSIVPSGLIINATDINVLDFIYIDFANMDATATGLYAAVQLSPVNYNPLFALTAVGNSSAGASGSLNLNSQEFAFNVDGSIELFLATRSVKASIYVEWESYKTSSFFDAQWNYYEDFQNTYLAEETGLPSFGFGIAWDMYSTDSEGFFSAIFQGWSVAINGIMQDTQSSVINAVNQQCANSIASVNMQLAQAERALQVAEAQANAAINSAEAKVEQAQQTVNQMQSTCQNYHSHCGWQFWNCIAFGFCEAGYGVATGALWLADEFLQGVEEAADLAIEAAEATVAATEVMVDGVIEAAEALVDGVMTAISWVMQQVLVAMEAIATAVGWLFNLQSISVGSTLNVANQEAVWAEMTVGFFGTSPRTYGFMLDVNNIDSAVSACVWFGQPAMNNWFNGQLSGTPAAAYQAQISQAMIQSSAAAVQMMGMSPASIIQPPIGPTASSSIYSGETFSNAPGTVQLSSPTGINSLNMGESCDVFMQYDGSIVWSTSATSSNAPCAMQIMPNGNVVVTDVLNNTIWQSFTAGTNASYLYVADDGGLYLTDLFGDIYWTVPAQTIAVLDPGLTLTNGQWLGTGGAINNFAISNLNAGVCSTAWDETDGLVIQRYTGAIWVRLGSLPAGNGSPWAVVNNGTAFMYVDAFGVALEGGNYPACSGSCILQFLPSTTQAAGTSQPAACELVYTNQPGTVVYSVVWASPPCPTYLYPGEYLYQTQVLCGSDGSYLVMQTDNNLVWYSSTGTVRWATATGPVSNAVYYFAVQTDNNLVIYNQANGAAEWASGSNKDSRGLLQTNSDGNFMTIHVNLGVACLLYGTISSPLWQTCV